MSDFTSPSGRMTEIEAQLVSRAAQDLAFRDRLLANPKTVLAEQGLVIPDDVQIQVLQETPNQYYLVLPEAVTGSESEANALSEQELEAIAGGSSTFSTCKTGWTGCGSGQSGCAINVL
ncbi:MULTISPECIES: NHLP leader peptide family RiPP precursor [Leptolyngbya]|uniref:NHLP leader peptide family RiPP precursor n=1 Tax=Leptolyngbya TaxID=47251 RepID=UPI00168A2DC3|nr:NHLP leader peptide family RiPP precursor [Leptolyngbya sp. FACHB-1624]MBD1856118.1 NHLP leader peptide family natural product precursor [Leptolyngbya sp. FACHB-1624]